jgi:hypothetical protein
VRLGEVNVRVPEAGGDDAPVARKKFGSGGDHDVRADGGDAAVADEDGGVFRGRFVGRDVDLGVADREGSGGNRLRRVRIAERGDEERVAGDGEDGEKRESEATQHVGLWGWNLFC